MAGRKNERDKGGGEEHLNDADVPVITAKDFGERIGVIDAEALRSACWSERSEFEVSLGPTAKEYRKLPRTDSQTAVVLVESYVVESCGGHAGLLEWRIFW